MGVSVVRSCMAESAASVERRAIDAGFAVIKNMDKRRYIAGSICDNVHCLAQVPNEGDLCPKCRGGGSMAPNLIQRSDDKSDEKGKFRGYSRSSISDRPLRQAKNKAWTVSRKNKRGKTARRYKRNKSRGNVRPAMRRQLGAGGSRASTKR